ncbi:CmcI family methyltransferase [Aquisphaera insulae]|uniref:CmcI family methyltransferase n=1 Tax=Aquisphaera insulae TaxID=2712864 RepID=UPI0013ED854F|nr:CmcI family methyltransferase [Aquisphaera insulae]
MRINRGGSAFFHATIFDLLGKGRVLTMDVQEPHDIHHPRVTFLIGSGVEPSIVERVRTEAKEAAKKGPTLVILDSDHSQAHDAKELELQAPMVTAGSFLLCQDGVYHELRMFSDGRPGPLKAQEEFIPRHPEFELDQKRCDRFLISHHPRGWLRRA